MIMKEYLKRAFKEEKVNEVVDIQKMGSKVDKLAIKTKKQVQQMIDVLKKEKEVIKDPIFLKELKKLENKLDKAIDDLIEVVDWMRALKKKYLGEIKS